MKFPVFAAYYLDFSYTTSLNMESRVFLPLPTPFETFDQENNSFNVLTLGFEMNSAYKEKPEKSGHIVHFLDKDYLYLSGNNFKSSNLNKVNLIKYITFKKTSDIFNHLEDNLPYYLEENRQGFLNAVQAKLSRQYKHLDLNVYESYEQRINRFTDDLNQFFLDVKNNQINIPQGHFAGGAVEHINEFNDVISFWQKQRLHEGLSGSLENKDNKRKNKI